MKKRRLTLSVGSMALMTMIFLLSFSPTAAAPFKAEPGDIMINEIMQNPAAVGDSAGEWFELYNPTASDIDINGWTIADNDIDSHEIINGEPLLIPAGGFLVLGNNADMGTNGGVDVAYSYGSSWFLSNSADEVVLYDATLTEIDRVEYDGGPIFPDPTGASMALIEPGLDNNIGANWCEASTPYGEGDFGTPGAANDCAPPVVEVVINEIMQNPSAVSDGAGEWFELYNPTAGDIDIDGWTIADNDSDSHVITNGAPLVIPAGGYLVLGNNTDMGANGGVDVAYSYGSGWFLSNSADEVVLYDVSLNEVDRVEYDGGPGFPDPNGASMALVDPALDNNVGSNWCTASTPFDDGDYGTPGAINDCPVAAPEVVINEIMQNPSAVSDGNGEWFELYNPTGSGIDIEGWTVQDNDFDSFVIVSGGPLVVPSEGYLVLGNNANSGANGGVTVDYQYSGMFLGNSADEIVLLDGAMVEVDRVEYDGGPDFPDPNGASMSLRDPVLDNNVGANWCESTTEFGAGDLGTPGAANSCEIPPVQEPVINEFVFNHTGSDTNEYLEVFGPPDTDYSAYTLLEIEGDSSGAGYIDGVFPVGTTDGSGFWFTGFLNNQIENGTVTLLLVEGFTGGIGVDLDTDNDGLLDAMPWDRIVDDVAVWDGGGSDRTYSVVELDSYYDGKPYAPGGASRIPNGFESDSPSDWVRNDFDGYGLPGFPGSQAIGEAVNTPGTENEVITVIVDEFGSCGDPALKIHDLQGPGDVSPEVGNIRVIEGIVVGDFDGFDQLRGFFLQEEDFDIDSDPFTSEGVFVYKGYSGPEVNLGDLVRVRGTVTEYFGLTELTDVLDVEVCGDGELPGASLISLPVPSMDTWEQSEGMLVEIDQELTVSGNYTWGRYGEVDLSVGGRLFNPTNVVEPGTPALALQDDNDLRRIQLDDGSTLENPLPLPPYIGYHDTLRAGDTTDGLIGALGYAFGTYEIHPVGEVTFERENERPYSPADVGGDVTVASFNVLNYFTTIDNGNPICGPDSDQDCRGADTEEEFTRQRDKIIAAIVEMDADVIGLMEIENHPTDAAVIDLVEGLNNAAGSGTYDFVATGPIGTDAIRVALIYKPASVAPDGGYAILDSTIDSRFNDEKNRPVLAQTFADSDGALFTVAVNHLKSKGSPCDDVGDPDQGDGQGNCNLTRKNAALAMADWLASDPTGSGDVDALIIGDLNSYAMEDPIDALEAAGYMDLVAEYGGEYAYSYVFQGQAGYLDHALANPSLALQVTGNSVWHINADEPVALDYNNYNQPALYQPDPFASSDHDPVLSGLNPNLPPVCDAAYTDPAELWPANHKFVSLEILGLTDPDGDTLTVTIESIFQDESVDDGGDGSTAPDAIIHEDGTFELRAERAGDGDGRFYHVSFSVDDGHSGSCTGEVLVSVPHDSGKKAEAAVDGGTLFDSTEVPELGDVEAESEVDLALEATAESTTEDPDAAVTPAPPEASNGNGKKDK